MPRGSRVVSICCSIVKLVKSDKKKERKKERSIISRETGAPAQEFAPFRAWLRCTPYTMVPFPTNIFCLQLIRLKFI